MQPAMFEIEILDEDEDVYNYFDIVISSNQYKASVQTYMYISDFKGFGEFLKHFPENSHEYILEVGEDNERFATYLFLKAYIYDTFGHAGLEVTIRKNGIPNIAAYAHFSISTEVATINAFGEALSNWADSGEKSFVFELYTSAS